MSVLVLITGPTQKPALILTVGSFSVLMLCFVFVVVVDYCACINTQPYTSGNVALCDWLQPQQVWTIGSCCGTRV